MMAILQFVFRAVVGLIISYILFVAVLSLPWCQAHVIYLYRVTLTWFQDVNYPERWGFLHNQVTPFHLRTPDGQRLHAWHVLPLELYRQHETALLEEEDGVANDITSRISFRILQEDPEALLVLYLHGAAGTLGSGWRPQSYRNLYSGASNKIHVVAIDYRGFGQSTGLPSEQGLLTDALTLAHWAMEVARIPPQRIVLFGQSLGTAVTIALAHHFAVKAPEPLYFRGMVLVAPFADVKMLTATYRVAGTIPLLSPLAYFPFLLDYLNSFIKDKWPSTTRLGEFLDACENQHPGTGRQQRNGNYHVTIIHAEDDYDIPWSHSEQVFWHAANAISAKNISFEQLEGEKSQTRKDFGVGGWIAERHGQNGLIRQHVLKHGLHDVIMSYPVVALAALRAFEGR